MSIKYYDMHEKVYQDLKERGFISWDREKNLEKIWEHQVNTNLLELLNLESKNLNNLTTLDLGTGTGNCALFCSYHGAKSIGIDLSKTAIEMAKINNEGLDLHAEFIEADILNLSLDKKFDLVTDSSLLHCLVGETDRTKFYEVAKKHLKENGQLFIHTMIKSEDMDFGDNFRMKNNILYSLGIADIEEGRVMIEGKSYFPHRTILAIDDLLVEIGSNGFQVSQSRISSHKDQPGAFIGLVKLK